MGRIGATLSGFELTLLNRLSESRTAATLNSLHLATGKRINAPSDAPSTFVKLAGFQTQLNVVTATAANVTAAGSMITQAQTSLDLIRAQLGTIRDELLEDEDGSLDAAQRAEAQAKIDTAVSTINGLASTSIEGKAILAGGGEFSVSGRNPNQVSDLTVYSKGMPGYSVAAEPAELTYTGADRYVADGATITIVGSLGTGTAFAVTTDDTLESVAASVNAETGVHGVVASVEDNTLTFQSVNTGAEGLVYVDVSAGTFTTSETDNWATGVGAVRSETSSIAGYVTQAATQAELTYTGSGSNPGDDAAITLTGSLGSRSFTVETTQTISELAAEINQYSHQTGVTASVDTVGANDVLTFTSVDYGTGAAIEVDVGSGAFAVAGGNGDGTANGTNVEAVLNGVTYTGTTAATVAQLKHREKGATFAANATVEITGHLGTRTYNPTTAKTLEEIAAEIAAESDLTGVTATVDGNDLVLTSTITGAEGEVSLNVTAGTFDTVDGATSATGADAVAGNTAVDGNRITVSQNNWHYEIEFAAGFSGTFNSMTVEGNALQFALATDLTRPSTLAISSVQASRLGGLSGTLDEIVSGQAYSGLGTNTSRALRIVDEALGELTRIEGNVDGFYTAAITSASSLMADLEEDLNDAIDQTDGYNEGEETLLLEKNEELISNALASLSILYQQRQGIVALIQQIAGLS